MEMRGKNEIYVQEISHVSTSQIQNWQEGADERTADRPVKQTSKQIKSLLPCACTSEP